MNDEARSSIERMHAAAAGVRTEMGQPAMTALDQVVQGLAEKLQTSRMIVLGGRAVGAADAPVTNAVQGGWGDGAAPEVVVVVVEAVEERDASLDPALPEAIERSPVVVLLEGHALTTGSREALLFWWIGRLAGHGFALDASKTDRLGPGVMGVLRRQSTEGRGPAPIAPPSSLLNRLNGQVAPAATRGGGIPRTRRNAPDERFRVVAERLGRELSERVASEETLERQVRAVQAELAMLRGSTAWSVAHLLVRAALLLPGPLRRGGARLLRGGWRTLRGRQVSPQPQIGARSGEDRFPGTYAEWIAAYDTLSAEQRETIRARVGALAYRPLISVVVPAYETLDWALRRTIESVQAQLYPHWELCIVDDASPTETVRRVVEAYAAADPRIKFYRREVNGHISEATNSGLAMAAGEFVALLDHDDLLHERALFEVASALNERQDLDIIFTDEDTIDANGQRSNPYFKTDWNPELLTGHNCVSHLGVYRRSLLAQIGGLRRGYEGSQDYDLILRAADATNPSRIYHIPEVLYHWRRDYGQASFSEAALERCNLAARRALADHLGRRGEAGVVTAHPAIPHWHRIVREVPSPAPMVSVIVPTRDNLSLLQRCLNGLLFRTDYPSLEIIVIDHESIDPGTLEYLNDIQNYDNVRVLREIGEFNYSAMNNRGAEEARGQILCLLNNDVEIIRSDWLAEMASLAVLPGVGAVGAKLLYDDQTIQHGGVVLSDERIAQHLCHGAARETDLYFGRSLLLTAVSAVTAACLVVRRDLYFEVGGLDAEALPVAYNDVDFCLKLLRNGLRNVWTPHAELFHHESRSRGQDLSPSKRARLEREQALMRERWGDVLREDRYYNRNLALNPPSFHLRAMPGCRSMTLELGTGRRRA